MTSFVDTIKNFSAYQKKRFPIVVLGLSFLPAILSSGAVVTNSVSITFVWLALLLSLTYLLHVRIIDEFRDYEHDLKHHKDRPLSVGTISLTELRRIDWLAILALVALAAYSGKLAFSIGFIMLVYSYLAQHEFFLGKKLRKHFYLYNAVNLVQMLLLQVLVYVLASEVLVFTTLLWTHFLFTTTGTIVFEFLRKVKSPGEDGTGRDTYTWFLGLRSSILLYLVLAVLNILLFVKLMFLASNAVAYWTLVTVFFIFTISSSALLLFLRPDNKTNMLMQLSFMVMYGVFNILVFLSV